MSQLLLIPIFLQGFVIFVDEFYFHLKRGLPKWERIGHPLDTISFLGCFAFTLLVSPSESHILIYAVMSVFSCIFVTKDEFVHAQKCSPGEHWMHAMLFLLHPICLYCFYRLWLSKEFQSILRLQAGAITLFLFYQIIYWQFFGKRDDAKS